MNKTTISIVIFSTIFLAGCQGTAPQRNVADDSKGEKAISSTKINLEVKDKNNQETPAKQPLAPIITNKVGIAITEGGLIPASLTATVGKELMIFNSLDKQVDLYTTVDGSEPCEELGATIEIPGGQTKVFPLNKTFSCTIINQQNTDQKTTFKVEPVQDQEA